MRVPPKGDTRYSYDLSGPARSRWEFYFSDGTDGGVWALTRKQARALGEREAELKGVRLLSVRKERTMGRRNPREGGYDDRSAGEAFTHEQEAMRAPDANSRAYKARHLDALRNPRGVEKGIVALILSWLVYADVHRDTYSSAVGEDGYAGPVWLEQGKGLIHLLSMDLGRMDGGALDSGIRAAMHSQGFTEEDTN